MSILTESLRHKIRKMGESGKQMNEETGRPLNGMSYVQGPIEPPLQFITIPQMMRQTVSRYGQREALVFPKSNLRRSYYEFARDIDALAGSFLALGLEKGERVGIWAPNRYEWVLTQFATARIGLILVNINPAYRLAEVEFALNNSGCKALIVAERFKSSDYLGMIRTLAPEIENCRPEKLRAEKLPHLRCVIALCDDPGRGIMSFEALRKLGGPAQQLRLDAIGATLNPDDPINIQFTSGTTGAPKGATLSHYNIVNNAQFVTDRIRLTENDRLCIPVPLYHCFGMVMGALGAVTKGAAVIFPDEGFDAEATLAALAEESCTATYGVPTMFVAMLQLLEKTPRDLTALRTGIMAGAPCPMEIMEQVNKKMHLHEITICYGMTETSPVSFQSFVDDPIDKRCSTVGRIHPHLEVKIIDQEGGIVPVGQQGELCTRGYSVMKGYWGDDEKTRFCIIDGWMHTGDLAILDEGGFCSITGRIKDMIIRGGENIYPREIEEFLFRHPDISQVQVFGIPDEKMGEEVCAWIIPNPGKDLSEEAVKSFCKDQIAHYKIPKYVRIVEQIPMTISGKPQKFIMRDKMLEMLKKEA